MNDRSNGPSYTSLAIGIRPKCTTKSFGAQTRDPANTCRTEQGPLFHLPYEGPKTCLGRSTRRMPPVPSRHDTPCFGAATQEFLSRKSAETIRPPDQTWE